MRLSISCNLEVRESLLSILYRHIGLLNSDIWTLEKSIDNRPSHTLDSNHSAAILELKQDFGGCVLNLCAPMTTPAPQILHKCTTDATAMHYHLILI